MNVNVNDTHNCNPVSVSDSVKPNQNHCQQYYDSPVNQIQKAKKDSAKDFEGIIVQVTYTVS